jgi:hypothetical protein
LFGRQPTAWREPLLKDLRFQPFCKLGARRHTSAGDAQVSIREVKSRGIRVRRHETYYSASRSHPGCPSIAQHLCYPTSRGRSHRKVDIRHKTY